MVHEKNGTANLNVVKWKTKTCVSTPFFCWCGSLTDCFLTLPLPHLLPGRETWKSCLEGIHLEKKDPLLFHQRVYDDDGGSSNYAMLA